MKFTFVNAGPNADLDEREGKKSLGSWPPLGHGMVKVRLLDGGHQYLPTNPDGYFWSDDEVVKAEDEYYELAVPYTLTAVAWSPGTSYDHTLGIRISVLRPEDVEASSSWITALKKFLNLIGIKV